MTQKHNRIIIGVCGKKRAGKDTVYQALKQANLFPLRLAFADELKREVAVLTGKTVEFIEEHKEDFRLGLQWWGDFRRKYSGINYWVDFVRRKIEYEIEHQPASGIKDAEHFPIIITDVRYMNEVEMIRQMGGYLWKVIRPEASAAVDPHASEHGLDGYEDWDAQIHNVGGLESMHVDTLIRYYYLLENRNLCREMKARAA